MKCRFLASKTYEIHENLRNNVNNCSTVKVVGGISSCSGENYKTLKDVVNDVAYARQSVITRVVI